MICPGSVPTVRAGKALSLVDTMEKTNSISKTPAFHDYPAHMLCFHSTDHEAKAAPSG